MNDAGTMEAATVEQLLARSGWLRKLAVGLLKDPEAADDAVQQAVITAWQRPPAERGGLRGWLGTVVTNNARSQARGDRRRTRLAAAAAAEPAPMSRTPEEVVAGLELQKLVATLLLELPEGHRQVIHLRFFEELDSPAIAARLGIAPGTVRWRLQAALGELRARLDQRDGEGGRKWRRALAGMVPALNLARRPVLWLLGAAGLASVTAVGAAVGVARSGARGAGQAAGNAAGAASSALGAGAGARPPGAPPARPPALYAAAGNPGDPSLSPAQMKTAPFAGLRWLAGDVPEVLVADSWARLLAIDGLAAERIVAFCKERYRARPGMPPELMWRKRFSEDLVEVLAGMGRHPREVVSLTLQRAGVAGAETVAARMTVENRQRLWRANLDAMGGLPSAASPVDPWTRVSPFSGIVFRGEAIDVEVQGLWYRLLSIAGVSAERLVTVAKDRFGERWKLRIAEDPVEVLKAATGNSPGQAVDLVLETKTPGNARRIEKRGVPLTEDNRQRVKKTWRP